MPCLSQCLAMALVAATAALASPSVNVGMNAAFPRAPYLLELLETAAEENSTAYFPLLDRIAGGHFQSANSDAELYDRFLEVLQQDGHITKPEGLSTFKLALSLRAAAPRIEAHYQYYITAVDSVPKGDTNEDCSTWALLDSKKYCSETLDKAVGGDLSARQANLLPFDRVLGLGKDVILYADPTSASFGPFHVALSKAAKQGDMSYRLRYRRSAGAPHTSLSVSGYGVKLDLKRTDYIVIDDREASQESKQKPAAADVDLDTDEEVADLKPLSTSELASLGLKTASFILNSENPLDALVKSTQDFPKFSASIATHQVAKEFAAEQEKNVAAGIPSGINFLWMNGVQLIERQIEPFTLIEMIRRERKLIDGVRDLGFNGQQANSLLGHSEVASSKAEDEPPRFDWTDRLEDGKALLWLNDLEKDARYQKLPSDLTAVCKKITS